MANRLVTAINDTADLAGRWTVVDESQAKASEVRSSIRPIISIVAIAAAPG